MKIILIVLLYNVNLFVNFLLILFILYCIKCIFDNITLYVFIFTYLLAQPVTIFVYGPVVYGPARYLHYFR